MSTPTVDTDRQDFQPQAGDGKASFAETALTLGGKSADEAKRTGAIDKADDQVEALFAPQYQTVNSPVHRAVWDRQFPIELFHSPTFETPPEIERVMQHSLAVVRRHREAGTVLDENHKVSELVQSELAEAGYWGL